MQWLQDKKFLIFINERKGLKQFIKFAFVGVFNTIVDFTAYIFCTRVLAFDYLIAATLAFILAVSTSFLLNKYWTFRANSNFLKAYLKFIIVAAGGLLWTIFLLFILVDKFAWYDLLAKLFVVVVVMNWNFFLQKYWTFKK